MTKPFTCYSKAGDKLKKHSSKTYHQDAMMRAENFLSTMTSPSLGIDNKFDNRNKKQIEINRRVIASVAETVLFCGRQGLALRGHNDDGILEDENTSNFNALLKFRIDSGDTVLAEHLRSCPQGASYVSKTIQNRLIDILAGQILAILLEEIRGARIFSVLADEVTDCSNWEQLSIVLRFVDAKESIREDFMGFVACERITGEVIANKILECFKYVGT